MRRSQPSLALLSTLLMALPAVAQDAFVLDPVVVSGGQDKVASDTPQSVSVVNQDELDQKQATTIGDALTDLPGVKAIGSERVLGESFNIRGIGESVSSTENRIIVQVDGATKSYEQYRMGALFTDPELYKRVEVLRGPASSTLYGSGALAGVITLETKDASDFLKAGDELALRQKLEATSNGQGGLTSTIMAWQPSEDLELLGAFIYRQNDDIEDADGTEIAGSAFDAPSVLVKGGYRFGENRIQAVELSYQYWTTQEDKAEYEQAGGSGRFGQVDREVTDKTLVLTYENTPLSSNLIDFNMKFSYSDTRVIQENAKNDLPPRFAGSVLFDNSEYAYETYQLSAENTSVFGALDGLQTFLTYGLQASRQTRVGKAKRGFIPFQPGGTDTKVAAFAQSELIFPGSGFTLIPGLRVEYAELKPDSLNTRFTESVTNTAISPKLAALYELNPNWSVFSSVAYTERLPTMDEAFDGEGYGNLDLEAETAITYELGASYSTNSIFAPGDALVAKATLFRNNTENLIENVRSMNPGVPGIPYRNVGEAYIQGLEVEGAYNTSRFFGSLAYTLIRGKGRNASGDPLQPLTTIPADELSLTLGTRFPAYNLEVGLRSVLTARQDDLPEGEETSPGHSIHNLFVTWRPEEGILADTAFRLGIENLFNVQYQEHLSYDPGRARTLRASVTRTF